MTREEFEKTKKGRLEDLQNRAYLFVAFGGIRQRLGAPPFEFFNSIANIDCDKIFLRDFQRSWYQRGIDQELNDFDKVVNYLEGVISKYKYRKVCFLGNSMGGYAAILFGTILDVDKVIAFAPQSFIDKFRRFIYRDKRSRGLKDNLYTYENVNIAHFDLKKFLLKNDSYKTEINIYYSALDRLDSRHAKRLKNRKNVILHPIYEGDHSVIRVVRGSGLLHTILRSTFE
ncbi:hypothetical protein [Phaeodactylibacter xiamenensis]|uniref:hypothetical protein n=1 Tax=Phaeodactylibacter xiamenensis TaxID=1524460 RepID=UPI0024A96209|nr:hypothetical protein [Phaeodactylibacter xiamenensis]